MERMRFDVSKKGMVALFGTAFLLLGLTAAFAQEAPPEQSSWYGDKGTFEIGLSGSINLPTYTSYSGTGAPESGDDNTTMIMVSPFFNYFVANQFHLGGALIYLSQINDTPGSEYRMTMSFLLARVGYTARLAPKFQIDFSGNLGSQKMTLVMGGTTVSDSSSFSYGYSAMALFPLTESAVLGVGLTMMWYKLDVGDATYTARARTTQIPFQVSFYF